MSVHLRNAALSLLLAAAVTAQEPSLAVDFRYAPTWWQTAICLMDDGQKTLVGKDGELLQDFKIPGHVFQTKFRASAEGAAPVWVSQRLESPRIPLVHTLHRVGQLDIASETFALGPAGGGRRDVIIVRYRNTGTTTLQVVPELQIEATGPLTRDPQAGRAAIGEELRLRCSEPFLAAAGTGPGERLRFASADILAGGSRVLAFAVTRGKGAPDLPITVADAEQARGQAVSYWQEAKLPYGRIEVPDAGCQALLDSSIRNIFQAREIKDGMPSFQVGATWYRGLWVVDGAFIFEAMTFLGLTDEVRQGITYMLTFQRPDGSFMLLDKHWKEVGIVLWAVTRHARLTNDQAWLRQVWPKVEKGFAAIQAMRKLPPAGAPNAGLIPDGFIDGGIGGPCPEYSSVYWSLVGMRAAADAAQWLGKEAQATAFQAEYQDLMAAFRRAAARDLKDDGRGNRYLPMRMDGQDAPQRAQWPFLQAVFPGRLFTADDPLVRGNLAMLRATEQQGTVCGTGWIAGGIWTYFSSFYGHSQLWLGDGPKAVQSLYSFANHASPLLTWREEQELAGKGAHTIGDMPHNWASAEFIRLVRHLLVLERGEELHLCEGLPAEWVRPGMTTRLNGIQTDFGPVSLEIAVPAGGGEAQVKVSPPTRNPAAKVVLHLAGWTPAGGLRELPARAPSQFQVRVR